MMLNQACLPDTGHSAYHRSLTNQTSVREIGRTAAGHPPQARRDSGDEPIAAEGIPMERDETGHLSDEEIDRGLAVWSEKAALALEGLALTWSLRIEEQLHEGAYDRCQQDPDDRSEDGQLSADAFHLGVDLPKAGRHFGPNRADLGSNISP